MKKSLITLLLVLFTVSLTTISCREQKSTGEKVEEAAEDAADDMEDAAEEVGDAVEDATD
ncbi:hypothetical protein [Aquimarina brevivitae]|uniref:Uncharacterized protein n=1 Tax=Aquimarina brevivitae TaxID=323412 RepID=A0A4Q7PJ19_9FLAO|nr:hypothetical protein [Aquimarina brevivitae]RZT00039.1 hypothetical protein EV197_1269 [Aquimarina brevivitae]